MDMDTIKHLCTLSRLKYSDEDLRRVMGEMTDILRLMDTVGDFKLVYDDTRDGNSVALTELREDTAQPSAPSEQILANAKSSDGCFIVPKVVD